MMPTGMIRIETAVTDLAVSILVLLDDAYRQLDRNTVIRGIDKFQSLFFWMMPTGKYFKNIESSKNIVSILVLLDDAYRR